PVSGIVIYDLFWNQWWHSQDGLGEATYKRALRSLEDGFERSASSNAMFSRLLPPGIGQLYALAGARDKATRILQDAILVEQALMGDDHPNVAEALYQLADIVKWSEKPPLLRRALAIYEKAYGPDYPGIAPIVNWLGTTNSSQMDDESEALFHRDIQ